MKAAISSTGVLTITAENDTESYALSQWDKNSVIDVNDPDRNEQAYYKGSSIKVSFENHYKSVCGTVHVKDGVPWITGLEQYTEYKGVFASDAFYGIAVDGITGKYGDIAPTTWTGIPKSGDVVKLKQN